MTDLATRRCQPCEGIGECLSDQRASILLAQLPGWKRAGDAIERDFEFDDYYQTVAFFNAVAYVAHIENHHPDCRIGYRRCTVQFTTHALGGLSENDFICAAKVSELGPGDDGFAS